MIFIGGIHGAGKSTLCNKVKNDFAIDSFTASQLIREVSGDMAGKNKLVKDVDDNQAKLIQQLKKYSEKGHFILDGHFTLLNKKKNIEKIPVNVFQQMNPSHMFLIDTQPQTILERLQQRDSKTYNITLINRMRAEEIQHAKTISEELNIPLYIIDGKDYSKMKTTVSSIISFESE